MPREDPESRPQTDVADADDAALAQRRLRDLLRATTTVVERLDLEVVLRRIVEAAMGLVDARYGALGVIAPDGDGLERFIHVGVDAVRPSTSVTFRPARDCSAP